jgi:hypothetical protein
MVERVVRSAGTLLVPFGFLFTILGPFGPPYWPWNAYWWFKWVIVLVGLIIALGGILLAANKMSRGWRIAYGLLLIPAGVVAGLPWEYVGVAVILIGLLVTGWSLKRPRQAEPATYPTAQR